MPHWYPAKTITLFISFNLLCCNIHNFEEKVKSKKRIIIIVNFETLINFPKSSCHSIL